MTCCLRSTVTERPDTTVVDTLAQRITDAAIVAFGHTVTVVVSTAATVATAGIRRVTVTVPVLVSAYISGSSEAPGLNAVKDVFTRENAWVYVVAEVVRLRAMPETTKFSRILATKILNGVALGCSFCDFPPLFSPLLTYCAGFSHCR